MRRPTPTVPRPRPEWWFEQHPRFLCRLPNVRVSAIPCEHPQLLGAISRIVWSAWGNWPNAPVSVSDAYSALVVARQRAGTLSCGWHIACPAVTRQCIPHLPINSQPQHFSAASEDVSGCCSFWRGSSAGRGIASPTCRTCCRSRKTSCPKRASDLRNIRCRDRSAWS